MWLGVSKISALVYFLIAALMKAAGKKGLIQAWLMHVHSAGLRWGVAVQVATSLWSKRLAMCASECLGVFLYVRARIPRCVRWCALVAKTNTAASVYFTWVREILWKFHSGLRGLIIVVYAATCNSLAKVTSLQGTDEVEKREVRMGRGGLERATAFPKCHVTEVYLQIWWSPYRLWLLSPTDDGHLHRQQDKIQWLLWHIIMALSTRHQEVHLSIQWQRHLLSSGLV